MDHPSRPDLSNSVKGGAELCKKATNEFWKQKNKQKEGGTSEFLEFLFTLIFDFNGFLRVVWCFCGVFFVGVCFNIFTHPFWQTLETIVVG